ncbi:PEP-CTERM sorting domain-containing protein [Janthinobacterium agaricidamnosum]|uniref:PEP-CTERM putative exosortase interaction domain protein n=1 Tax=Janthinobacterium agaricidamnosum NBRC 102515 = DSM 9628 TaxID=1349767 RepID=W0V9M0_9BURK|nr:PEP-CTERM sorting domain-containing protein [Janthinobacterium agaricidamnosum]CDG84591.1 PEP-CTERM putative exosortase interaction domain protein [Janthinobacterium agaricidamnosum NBRC 102515 = DSM 9628]
MKFTSQSRFTSVLSGALLVLLSTSAQAQGAAGAAPQNGQSGQGKCLAAANASGKEAVGSNDTDMNRTYSACRLVNSSNFNGNRANAGVGDGAQSGKHEDDPDLRRPADGVANHDLRSAMPPASSELPRNGVTAPPDDFPGRPAGTDLFQQNQAYTPPDWNAVNGGRYMGQADTVQPDLLGITATASGLAPPGGGGVGGGGSAGGVETAGNIGSNPVAPVPEPETYAMLLAGLAVIGVAVRKRRGKRGQG